MAGAGGSITARPGRPQVSRRPPTFGAGDSVEVKGRLPARIKRPASKKSPGSSPTRLCS
jgi:hypothetical protein